MDFFFNTRTTGGGDGRDTLAILPVIELELRDKNERVQGVETKRLVSLVDVLDHLVTYELGSMTLNRVLSFLCRNS